MLADLNNVQPTNISDIHEDCIPRPVEMKKNFFLGGGEGGGGGLRIIKYFRPPWLAEEEHFSFQIV